MNKQKGSALIFLLVGVLVIAAIGGAYYLGRSTTSTPSPVSTSQIPQPTIPSSSTDETTRWKTYTNNKYGYSFKYPTDWTLEENEMQGFQSIALTKTDNTQEQEQVLLPGDQNADVIYKIITRVETNPKGYTAKEYLLQNISPESLSDYEKNLEEINLNGFPAIKRKEACAPCSGMEVIITLIHRDKIYSLSYGAMAHEETHDKFLNTFNQILSTFRFD